MSEVLDKLNVIKEKQKTIDALLEAGDMKKRNGDNDGWTLNPIYHGEYCDIGFVHISSVSAGRCPDHIHENSIEYLIVVRGSILFNVGGRDLRVIKEGEIGVVPANQVHHSKPLTDDTKLVYVCVPKDTGMDKLREAFRCQK